MNHIIKQMKNFRTLHTREQRLIEFKRLFSKYPSRIPIVIDIEGQGLILDKRKYLAEADMFMMYFQHTIRQRLKVGPNESLFFFYENIIPNPTQTLGQIYGEHKSEDGFMVLTVAKENVFG
jgi:GABA(A) receptor-associated protein